MAKEVRIATYPNEMEARLWAQRLEEHGIPSVVRPLGAGYGALGAFSFIHHGLYVLEERAEEASRIVAGDQ
ncbi:MAG: DUF2007 domain-containing protein [Chloroflexi bacterium]|nr:DUF2007 domain-containing protein [Chloroflexota bacterium]